MSPPSPYQSWLLRVPGAEIVIAFLSLFPYTVIKLSKPQGVYFALRTRWASQGADLVVAWLCPAQYLSLIHI